MDKKRKWWFKRKRDKEGQRLFIALVSAFLEATPPVVSRVTLRSS
jgi:hypothetical protein